MGERIHIGKSSSGWHFALHVTDKIRSLEDWEKVFKKGSIKNEYGDKLSPNQMMDIITKREWHKPKANYKTLPVNYASRRRLLDKNCAEEGFNGLIRSKIMEGHCIGHGDGTWDLITGEFC